MQTVQSEHMLCFVNYVSKLENVVKVCFWRYCPRFFFTTESLIIAACSYNFLTKTEKHLVQLHR